MIRLSDPAESIFDYPTNDTTRRATGENLVLLFFSLFLSLLDPGPYGRSPGAPLQKPR